jgi:hypothetical protein
MGKLVEQVQIYDWTGLGTVDIDTDRVLDYINCRNYRRALVIFVAPAGTAGDNWNFTVRQAKTAAGGSVKDLDIVDEYWLKQVATNLNSTDTFTRSTQTADALISGDSNSGAQVGTLVLDLDLSKLDTANDFFYLGGAVTQDASSAAQVCGVILQLYDPRYPQATALGAQS